MLVLLRELDGLRRLVTHLHAEPTLVRRDREVAIAELADEVEGFAGRPLVRHPHRVVRHALLDHRTHLRCGPEEAVGRDQTLDPLMRTVKVVPIDEEPKPPVAIREVGKHRLAQEFVPERLPEALDLAERLRMLRPALHVTDAFAAELLLEFGLAPPRRVLPPLVSQDLSWSAVRGDAASQRLHHQAATLMMRQRVGHDEARVVVHEAGEVQPFMAPEEKREDVRLPHLIRLGALEATLRMRPWLSLALLLEQALLVEHSTHVGLAHAQPLASCEFVADTTRSVARRGAPCPHDRFALGIGLSRLRTRSTPPWLECIDPSGFVGAQPDADRCHAQAEGDRDPADGDFAFQHRLQHTDPELQRVCLAVPSAFRLPAGALSLPYRVSFIVSSPTHPLASSCPGEKGGGC
jgi:hypothetical protein